MGTTDRYAHPSQDRTIDEHHPPRTISSDIPPLPMPPMDTTPAPSERATSITRDQFSTDAIAFITNSIDTYPIYRYQNLDFFSLLNKIRFLVQCQQKLFYLVLIVFQVIMYL